MRGDLGKDFLPVRTGWTAPPLGQNVVVPQSSTIRSPTQLGEQALGVAAFENVISNIVVNYWLQLKKGIDGRRN